MKKPLYREALTPKNRPFPQYLSLRKREDVVFSLRGDFKGDVHSSYEGIKWERCIFFGKNTININGLGEVTIFSRAFIEQGLTARGERPRDRLCRPDLGEPIHRPRALRAHGVPLLSAA